MNKIIQINLAGQAVSIDEQAYETLRNYLKTLEEHFKHTNSGAEILQDIEARLAELFIGKTKVNNSFISEKDVNEAIALMGTPADMGIDEDPIDADPSKGSYEKLGKKLFRDADDKVLGGVCSGLGAYLNIDATVIRIITLLLVLFGGLSIIPYLILWAVIPSAKTAQDRFRMHGETPNINDIANNIRNEANEVASNLKKNPEVNSAIRTIGDLIERIVKWFSKIFGAGMLTILVVAGVVIAGVLMANATGTAQVNINGSQFTAPQLFDSMSLNWIFSVSLLSVILIPIGAMCFAIVQFIFNLSAAINFKAIFLAWLFSLAIFISISIYAAKEINYDKIYQFRDQFEETNAV
jgi:phage shock protein C